jgi:nitroreductase
MRIVVGKDERDQIHPSDRAHDAHADRGALPSRHRALEACNATLETILSHRSVRAYRQDQLPPQTLELLVAAAQSASTSSNLQAWSVVAVEDSARKSRLAALAGGRNHIVQCPLFLVWLADLARLEDVAHEAGRSAAGLDYLECFIVAVVDTALARAKCRRRPRVAWSRIGLYRRYPQQA